MYPHFAVIALGSNLANPTEQVRAALAELDAHPHIRLEKASSLYLTAPVGYDDQPGANVPSVMRRALWTWISSILMVSAAMTRI